MASTFHFFSRLPAELRVLVWELALRPCTPYMGGLNYVSVQWKDDEDDADTKPSTVTGKNDVDTKPLTFPHNWRDGSKLDQRKRAQYLCNRAQDGVASNPDYRSACLWDSGLLTACKESRDVIMRRYRKYEQSTQICPWNPNKHIFNLYQKPTIEPVSDRDEDWFILFQHNKDLTCLTFWNWEALGNSLEHRFGWTWQYDCAFISTDLMLACEFDTSWILDWPRKEKVFFEASTRGLLARVLRDRADKPGECSIWLIDRKAAPQKISGSRETPRRTFYDMDQHYVEAKHVSAEVSEFLDKLENALSYWESVYGRDIDDGFSTDSDEWHEVGECVKVLVRVRDSRPTTETR
ncbi:hypothetical protein QQS21_008979 [Conoideocrella luteorostrata]|uniref:2EXR domain-containing protein n=1 Tax=Conoideocrella luteorostrata TaxID=1105319 RepID=A0AAJ0FQQ4_9HYPO|nr:hypothetical protein QQS21_008979 [Conoideocrella luteorostrata]